MNKKPKRDVVEVVTGDTTQDTAVPSQRDILNKRVADLEVQVVLLEEKAEYAEKEAELRKKIADARRRVAATKPQGVLSELLPVLDAKLPKGGARVMLVLLLIFVAILAAVKTCG